MHSEQPDTYGHKVGPTSTDVSGLPHPAGAACLNLHAPLCAPPVEQSSEDGRPDRGPADGRTQTDETAPVCQHHPGGRPRYGVSCRLAWTSSPEV